MKDQDNNIDIKTEDANSTEDSLKASDVEEQEEEKTLEEKYDETYDALLRAKAEVENIKKRSEKEISNAYKFSTEGIFLDLIPIFESLDIAITQASETTNIDNLIEGNKLLKSMFDTFLEKNSLEAVSYTHLRAHET